MKWYKTAAAAGIDTLPVTQRTERATQVTVSRVSSRSRNDSSGRSENSRDGEKRLRVSSCGWELITVPPARQEYWPALSRPLW